MSIASSEQAARHGFGANTDNTRVGTPPELYQALDAEFHFDHDPCPLERNDSTPDGLSAEARWGARNFVNPPYSECERWLERAAVLAEQNQALSVCLVPLRPNTRYWARWVWPRAHELRVLDRRVSFAGYQERAPMALCVIVYAPTSRPRRGTVKHRSSGRYGYYRIKL